MIELTQQEIDENAACRIRRYEFWCILHDSNFLATESQLDEIESIFQQSETTDSFAKKIDDYALGRIGRDTSKQIWDFLNG